MNKKKTKILEAVVENLIQRVVALEEESCPKYELVPTHRRLEKATESVESDVEKLKERLDNLEDKSSNTKASLFDARGGLGEVRKNIKTLQYQIDAIRNIVPDTQVIGNDEVRIIYDALKLGKDSWIVYDWCWEKPSLGLSYSKFFKQIGIYLGPLHIWVDLPGFQEDENTHEEEN